MQKYKEDGLNGTESVLAANVSLLAVTQGQGASEALYDRRWLVKIMMYTVYKQKRLVSLSLCQSLQEGVWLKNTCNKAVDVIVE